MVRIKKKYFLVISIGLFLISLSQRAYCTNGDCGEIGSGLLIFLSGFFGLFIGGACLTWLANPLLIVSWILFNSKKKTSLVLSSISLLIGLSFLLFNEIIINEAGNYGEITGYEFGYWLWLLSMATMLIGGIYIQIKNRQINN